MHCIKTPARIFFIAIAAMIFFTSDAYSQKTENNFSARKTFYADFASRGAYYSVNYDRIFNQGKQFTKSYRAGFSIFKNVIALPLGINYFTHPEQDSHVELSLTVVPYIEDYKSFLAPNDLSDKKIDIIPGIGYRYQKPGGGFFFKAVAAPLLYLDPPSDHFWKMDGKLYAAITVGAGISF